MKELELYCIMCPASCTLRVIVKDREIQVYGNQCPRGVEYAKQEVLEPRRHVMSVVRVKNGDMPTVSVVTRSPVPKDCIWRIMEQLAKIELEAPVEIGDVVIRDICGTDIIATRRVKRIELL
jgi:CxxC motif-containing protein